MIAKVKEKLIQWSRKTKIVEEVEKFYFVLVISTYIPFIFMWIWEEKIPLNILFLYTNLTLLIYLGGAILATIVSVLNAIKYKEKYLENNKFCYILLSEKNVIYGLLFILMTCIFILIYKFNIWLLYTLCILSIFFLPQKIAKYFEKKLSE